MIIFLITFLVLFLCDTQKKQTDTAQQTQNPYDDLDDVNVIINPVIEKILSRISHETIGENINKLASFETRHILSDTTSTQRGIGAARRWIYGEFKNYKVECGGRLQLQYDKWRQNTDSLGRVNLVNIIATLPGKSLESLDRTLIICAHYDSRATNGNDALIAAPGADDNASGVVVVMELARLFSLYQFETNIVFGILDGSEHGQYGSTRLTEGASRNNWNVDAVISLDAVGNIIGSHGNVDSTTLRCFSEGTKYIESPEEIQIRKQTGGESDSPSRQLARYFKRLGEAYVEDMSVKLVYRPNQVGRTGDHIPFNQKGFTAIGLSESIQNSYYRHQNVRIEDGKQFGDLPEFISTNYVYNVAKLTAATLASLALAPNPPQDVCIDGTEEHDTLLTWQNLKTNSDLSDYKIYVRETTSPIWQKQIFTNNINPSVRCILRNITPDDYFFAVAAIDLDGNETIPIFPKPLQY